MMPILVVLFLISHPSLANVENSWKNRKLEPNFSHHGNEDSQNNLFEQSNYNRINHKLSIRQFDQYSAKSFLNNLQKIENYRENPNPLLRTASTTSLVGMFAIFLWRSMASYELAKLFNQRLFRFVCAAFTLVLFGCNAFGIIFSLFPTSSMNKSKLKVFLRLNILREVFEIFYDIYMAITVSRDFYVGRMIPCIYFTVILLAISSMRLVDPRDLFSESYQNMSQDDINYEESLVARQDMSAVSNRLQ